MSGEIKEYTKEGLTVVWNPHICTHSGICAKSLPEVFNPRARPWVNVDGKSIDEIKSVIDKCPSGALSYRMTSDGQDLNVKNEIKNSKKMEEDKIVQVEVIPNGPLIVKETCQIKHKDGANETKETRASFCRCGASANKPFCDGAHRKIEFKDE